MSVLLQLITASQSKAEKVAMLKRNELFSTVHQDILLKKIISDYRNIEAGIPTPESSFYVRLAMALRHTNTIPAFIEWLKSNQLKVPANRVFTLLMVSNVIIPEDVLEVDWDILMVPYFAMVFHRQPLSQAATLILTNVANPILDVDRISDWLFATPNTPSPEQIVTALQHAQQLGLHVGALRKKFGLTP